MRRLLSRLRTDEHGVTLVELVVTIFIVGLILSTITIAVVMGFENTSNAEGRVDRSNVAEFAARYFTSDAVSSAVDQSATTPCAGAGSVVTVLLNDATTVSYAVVSSAGRTTLFRRTCTGGGPVTEQTLGSSRLAFEDDGSACPSGAGAACVLALHWPGDPDSDVALTVIRRSA